MCINRQWAACAYCTVSLSVSDATCASMTFIVAVKFFRTITHNTHIIARAMLIRVYTLMECAFYRDNKYVQITFGCSSQTWGYCYQKAAHQKPPWKSLAKQIIHSEDMNEKNSELLWNRVYIYKTILHLSIYLWEGFLQPWVLDPQIWSNTMNLGNKIVSMMFFCID